LAGGIGDAQQDRVTRRRQTQRTLPDHPARRIDERGRIPRSLHEPRFDAYGVLSEVARGGTSTVYLGEDRKTGERVAIKALDPFHVGCSDTVRRLLGEHDLARRVRHPGLLEIRAADQTSLGVPYLVMEYLDGESLTDLVDREALSTATILAIAAQIASALVALHAAGIVHCDIKPDNVLVLDEPGPGGWPRIKIVDFGVARLIQSPALPDGAIAGTPAFMAPEQWHGAPTPKSDVYALGCVLYELVTGAPVFSGALTQMMLGHCERMPERPSVRCPGIDPELERVIIRALAKDPAMRPTMADLDVDLARLAPGNLAGYLEAVG
jgi:serine/threonine-protein kinase